MSPYVPIERPDALRGGRAGGDAGGFHVSVCMG